MSVVCSVPRSGPAVAAATSTAPASASPACGAAGCAAARRAAGCRTARPAPSARLVSRACARRRRRWRAVCSSCGRPSCSPTGSVRSTVVRRETLATSARSRAGTWRDRRRGDDEQPEHGEHGEQQGRDVRSERGDDRRAGDPAEPAPAVLHRGAAVGGDRGAVGDVPQPAAGEHERAPADDDAPGGGALPGVAQDPPGEGSQQQRHRPVQPAGRAGDHGAQDAADRPGDVPPGGRGDDDRAREEEQPEPVAAYRRVQLARPRPRAVTEPAGGAAEHVADAQPERPEPPADRQDQPGDRVGTRGCGGVPGGGSGSLRSGWSGPAPSGDGPVRTYGSP